MCLAAAVGQKSEIEVFIDLPNVVFAGKHPVAVLVQEGLGTIIQMHPSVVFRAERLNTA